MILVDDRVGSEDLAGPLTKAGVPAELVRMDSGDVAFEGRGPNGTTLNIGVELKKLGDLVGSLRSGRLSEQLAKMIGPTGAYDYGWLLIEGYWRTGPTGLLTLYKGKKLGWMPLPGGMSVSEMEKHVLTLELCGGFHVRYSNSRHDTLQFLVSLYRWWNDRAFDKHTSHLQVHTPVSFLPVSDFRAAVQRFPGVGLRTSLAVETRFKGSLRKAVNASVEDWASIQTLTDKGKPRKLGMKVAETIVAFCKGDQ